MSILTYFTKQYPVELIDADQKLTYEAAKLQGRYKIAYADCFAAAFSHRLNAVIVTGDPESKKLGGKYSIQWLDTKEKYSFISKAPNRIMKDG